MKRQLLTFTITGSIAVLISVVGIPDAQAQRSRREYISVNTDVYEVSVRRDGSADINGTDGFPFFRGAQARVRYATEERFRRLDTNATRSTRFQVNDRLGQGQGLLFNSPACEWYLCAYPGQPYFSIRLVFKNAGKAPVTVAALSPWFISPDTKGMVSVGDASGDIKVVAFEAKKARIRNSSGKSDHRVVIRNPLSGRTTLAGFLTHNHAKTYFWIGEETPTDGSGFGTFQAVCEFEPPVVVMPGETLEAENLYISVGDIDVAIGMERFGAAVAATHGLQPGVRRTTSGLEYAASPAHGFTESQMIDAIQWQREHLWQWRWREFTVGAGWEVRPGDWLPSPERFSNGFTQLQAAAKDAGINVGIRCRPFLVAADSTVAKNNPDWLLPYKRDANLFVLDVTIDEVRQWLTQLAQTLTQEYGFDSLLLEETDCLLHCELPPSSMLTRIQFYRMGLQAIHAGIPAGKMLAVTPWQPAALPYADIFGVEGATAPNWASVLKMDAALSLQAHLYPTGILPDAGVLFLSSNDTETPSAASEVLPMSREQSIAWLVAASMNASPVRLGNAPETIGIADIALLGRFSPPLPRPAYSISADEVETFSIRHLPLRSKAGEWHLVAFFNWSRLAPTVVAFDKNSLGLEPDSAYTLYEFFPGVYHGLLGGATSIAVSPASVRLFGLRPYDGQPMLLASDRHISQGALDHESIVWDNANKRLTGTFRADPVPYCLRILMPTPWHFREVHVSVDRFESQVVTNDVIELNFDVETRQSVTWHVEFE